GDRPAGQLSTSLTGALALQLFALPPLGGRLVRVVRIRLRVVDPPVRGRRAYIDVDEISARVQPDAHAAAVEGGGVVADLGGLDAGDADVAGGAVEVVAGGPA